MSANVNLPNYIMIQMLSGRFLWPGAVDEESCRYGYAEPFVRPLRGDAECWVETQVGTVLICAYYMKVKVWNNFKLVLGKTEVIFSEKHF